MKRLNNIEVCWWVCPVCGNTHDNVIKHDDTSNLHCQSCDMDFKIEDFKQTSKSEILSYKNE